LLCFRHARPLPPLSALSLHDALPISLVFAAWRGHLRRLEAHHALPFGRFCPPCRSVQRLLQPASGEIARGAVAVTTVNDGGEHRSEEHTSELQSRVELVCRLLLEKKK